MTTIYLIRHAEAEGNLYRIFQGHKDVMLTERGELQVRALAERFREIPVDAVYSSDLSRAWETCELALGKVPYVKDARLREIDVGTLVGLTAEECTERYGQGHFDAREKLDFSPYGGECREDLLRRIRSFLKELQRSEYERVAVFTHAGLILALLEAIWGFAVSGKKIHRANCMVAALEYTEGIWRLYGWNMFDAEKQQEI